MLRNLILLLPLAAMLAGCDNAEKEALQRQVDSLNIELVRSHQMSETLAEVGSLLDSIDASRHLLRIDMVEGTYDDYAERMRDLNNYVQQSERKIMALEQALKSSSGKSAQLARAVERMKAELLTKSQEIALLQEQLEKYKNEN